MSQNKSSLVNHMWLQLFVGSCSKDFVDSGAEVPGIF